MGSSLLSPVHLVILLVVVLLLFGAKRLPEIGRSLGTGMREFKDSVTASGSDHVEATRSELPPPVPAAQAPPAPVPAAPAPAAPAPAAPPESTPPASATEREAEPVS
jgi:sec-independent protein translocase protein TatA